MEQQLENALQIRYIKLHITAAMLEGTRLPADKVSALRGGMGEMLLRANCVRDRDCAKCDFAADCIVQHTMYSKSGISPRFVTTKDSVGYILECADYKEEFYEGDPLHFNLILFGKAIAYFNQYMQAFFALGRAGIGKNHSRFQIMSVTNSKKQRLLEGNSIYMRHYRIQTLQEYVKYRMGQLWEEGCENTIQFQTPLTLKYHDAFLWEFHMEALWNAVRRRIYMLECYEGITDDIYQCGILDGLAMPELVQQAHETVRVRRYSSTQDRKMVLSGIRGYAVVGAIPEEMLAVLLAGELTHIGKNTSFGFGKYRIT